MEVNPQWVIPMSIIEDDVAKRAGDTTYFNRNRYHIFDRQTNKELPVTEVSKAMLLSGKYRVAQEGGAGNSLGRIIFRFKNNFSVFLHDTSNPGAFERSQRSMSHGCVRVAKPFNLCQFVLGEDADEWLMDRIRISMGRMAGGPYPHLDGHEPHDTTRHQISEGPCRRPPERGTSQVGELCTCKTQYTSLYYILHALD